eukprot:COSAG02_NODE_44_length_45948_cov_81.673493_25_plen_376_part_00
MLGLSYSRYLFDINGYLVVKKALTDEQLQDCRERLAERLQREPSTGRFGSGRTANTKGHKGSDRTRLTTDESGEQEQSWSSPSLVEWGGAFIDLIDLPTIAPKLSSLFGDAPYRMDHDCTSHHHPLAVVVSVTPTFLVCLTKERPCASSDLNVHNSEQPGGLYLHGGGQGAGGPSDLVGPSDGGQCYYRYSNGKFFVRLTRLNDKSMPCAIFILPRDFHRACIPYCAMQNGLIAVAFELETVQPGHGVSHWLTSLPDIAPCLCAHFVTTAVQGFACVAGSHKANVELPRDWKTPGKTQADAPDCVHRVAVEAGDAIICETSLFDLFLIRLTDHTWHSGLIVFLHVLFESDSHGSMRARDSALGRAAWHVSPHRIL